MNNYRHLFSVNCSACGAPNDWEMENLSENVARTEDHKYRVTCTTCKHVDTYDTRQVQARQIPNE
jgi:endogenous inhibitor of DNA gyrase (YacG/DUF329 family)